MQTESSQQIEAGREHSAPRRIVLLPELQHRFGGVHRTTIWRWWHAGVLPTPVRLGGRLLGWYSDELEVAIEKLQRIGTKAAT